MADMNKSVAQCAPCLKSGKRQNASVHCDTCDQFQCQECVRVHELYDFMAGHTFKDLHTPRARSQDLFSCDVHNKPYEIFCDDHQVLCCSYCAVESHRKCEHVRAVGQQAQRTKIKPSEMIERMQETKKIMSKTSERITAFRNALHATLHEVSSRLHSVKQKIMLKATSTNPFDQYLESLLEQGKYKEEYLEKLYKNTHELCIFYKSLVYRQDINRCFVGNCVVRQRLADIVKESCSYLDGFREIYVSVCFHNTLSYIDSTEKVFKIVYSISPCTLKGSPNVRCYLPFQIHEIRNSFIRLKERCDVPIFDGIDFLRDGRLVTTESTNHLVVILNEDMEEVSSIALKVRPMDVTTISRRKVVVSAGNSFSLSVIHIDSSGNIVRSQSIEGQSLSMDNYYNSVCKYSEDTVVVGPV